MSLSGPQAYAPDHFAEEVRRLLLDVTEEELSELYFWIEDFPDCKLRHELREIDVEMTVLLLEEVIPACRRVLGRTVEGIPVSASEAWISPNQLPEDCRRVMKSFDFGVAHCVPFLVSQSMALAETRVRRAYPHMQREDDPFALLNKLPVPAGYDLLSVADEVLGVRLWHSEPEEFLSSLTKVSTFIVQWKKRRPRGAPINWPELHLAKHVFDWFRDNGFGDPAHTFIFKKLLVLVYDAAGCHIRRIGDPPHIRANSFNSRVLSVLKAAEFADR